MSEYRQSGSHPDADQLNAFLSGALSQEARRESLAHLAQCAECRRIVFMAQAATPQPASEKSAGKSWNRWLPALALTAATVAVIAAIVWTRRNPTARPAEHQVAMARPPASTVVSSAPAPPVAANHPLQQAMKPSRRKRGETSMVGRPAYPLASNAVREAPEGAIGELIAGPVAGSGAQLPEMKKQAPTPLPGANTGASAAPRSSPNALAKAAPAQQRLSTPEMPALQREATTVTVGADIHVLNLKIEPNQGPRDGLSELKGTVTDTTGAMVPGAHIAVQRSSDGGTAAIATSDLQGQFALTGVPPGQYALKVSASGFKTESQQLDLHAHDLALLSPVLQVGSSSETVTVKAAAPALDTSSAEIAERSAAAFLLPTNRAPIKTVQHSGRILALDGAGILFLSRNAGKRWRKVKPVWKDTIAQLALAPQLTGSSVQAKEKVRETSSKAFAFQITTANGVVWLSSDGLHWHRR